MGFCVATSNPTRLLHERDEGVDYYFEDIWGNSSSEVFVTINDRSYQDNACGVSFVLWFDGAEFHQF